MNQLIEVEKKSFKTFITFTFFIIILNLLTISIFSSKYRVSYLDYGQDYNLNYDSLKNIEGQSIWLIDDADFDKFYDDNLNIENLKISKDLPNSLVIEVTLHKKIISFLDLRNTSPQLMLLYKNLHTEETLSKDTTPLLTITNGPIPDGFYSEIVSFILTVEKYDITPSKINITFDGQELSATYDKTTVKMGKPIDLSRKGSVVGYIFEEGNCLGEVSILDTQDEDIETLFRC